MCYSCSSESSIEAAHKKLDEATKLSLDSVKICNNNSIFSQFKESLLRCYDQLASCFYKSAELHRKVAGKWLTLHLLHYHLPFSVALLRKITGFRLSICHFIKKLIHTIPCYRCIRNVCLCRLRLSVRC